MSEEYSKDFQKEISILSELRHPNVILMLGVCVPPDPCAIVTELFERGSLQHVLDSKEPLTLSNDCYLFVLTLIKNRRLGLHWILPEECAICILTVSNVIRKLIKSENATPRLEASECDGG